MEQKAKMVVFWEHDGKSEVEVGDKGGVCFLLREDGVRVVANYKARSIIVETWKKRTKGVRYGKSRIVGFFGALQF